MNAYKIVKSQSSKREKFVHKIYVGTCSDNGGEFSNHSYQSANTPLILHEYFESFLWNCLSNYMRKIMYTKTVNQVSCE